MIFTLSLHLCELQSYLWGGDSIYANIAQSYLLVCSIFVWVLRVLSKSFIFNKCAGVDYVCGILSIPAFLLTVLTMLFLRIFMLDIL